MENENPQQQREEAYFRVRHLFGHTLKATAEGTGAFFVIDHFHKIGIGINLTTPFLIAAALYMGTEAVANLVAFIAETKHNAMRLLKSRRGKRGNI